MFFGLQSVFLILISSVISDFDDIAYPTVGALPYSLVIMVASFLILYKVFLLLDDHHKLVKTKLEVYESTNEDHNDSNNKSLLEDTKNDIE